MKKLALATILLAMSASSHGIVSRNIDSLWISNSEIKIIDRLNAEWTVKQDCDLNLSSDSDVAIISQYRHIRPQSKIVIRVDGERNTCRVLDITEIANNKEA